MTKLQKILFIIPSLGGGGAEKVLVDLLDNFDYSRYAVSLLVIHHYGPYVGKVNKNVNVISVEKGAITFYNRVCGKILRNIGLYKYVCRKKCEKLVQSDFDVVISFTTNEALFYHSFIMKKGKRNLSWVHIDVEKNRYSYPFSSKEEESKVYSQMDEIIFVSNDAKNAFNNVFSINVPQKVIYNIVDKEKIDSLSKKENVTTSKFTIISIGRLVEVKGFDKIIKIASALKNKGYDLKFCILGIGELEYQLKDMAKTYGVEDVVEFLGFKNNPYPYLANSDIFLSTSISEAFSLVVAEALCLGVPVISTKTTGPIEIIDNEYGILTEQNEDDIMNAIIRLIEDPKLRLLYKNKAKERACMFDTTKTMNKIYTILGK